VTAHPTAGWVWRQLIEATPWDRKPRYLIHDRDRVWGADFSPRLARLGIKSLRTPIQAPRANSVGERWVRTIRRECLDHLIPLSERHLRRILAEFVDYYNHDRPHRSLGLQAPLRKLQASQGRSSHDQFWADSTTSTREQLEPDRLLPPYNPSIVQRKVISPNDFPNVSEVERRLLNFERRYERAATPFEWKFTRRDLANQLRRLALHSRAVAARKYVIELMSQSTKLPGLKP
jgi:hypothetical protein